MNSKRTFQLFRSRAATGTTLAMLFVASAAASQGTLIVCNLDEKSKQQYCKSGSGTTACRRIYSIDDSTRSVAPVKRGLIHPPFVIDEYSSSSLRISYSQLVVNSDVTQTTRVYIDRIEGIFREHTEHYWRESNQRLTQDEYAAFESTYIRKNGLWGAMVLESYVITGKCSKAEPF